MLLNLENPVTTAHRAKLAYIYVRQSRLPVKSDSIRRARSCSTGWRIAFIR
jgi:hypothetical protein